MVGMIVHVEDQMKKIQESKTSSYSLRLVRLGLVRQCAWQDLAVKECPTACKGVNYGLELLA